MANLCLMGLKDELDDNEEKFSYDELLEAFQEFHDECKFFLSKHTFLHEKNIELFN